MDSPPPLTLLYYSPFKTCHLRQLWNLWSILVCFKTYCITICHKINIVSTTKGLVAELVLPHAQNTWEFRVKRIQVVELAHVWKRIWATHTRVRARTHNNPHKFDVFFFFFLREFQPIASIPENSSLLSDQNTNFNLRSLI